MKLTISKISDPRPRHVVLICSEDEKDDVRSLIMAHVLPGKKVAPNMEVEGGKVYFRFNMMYLDRLYLTFPMAELSPGISAELITEVEKVIKGQKPPSLTWPGFNGKLLGYQKVGAGAICSKKYAKSIGLESTIDFLNDGLGLGKTFMLLAAYCRMLDKQPEMCGLLAAPNNAKYDTWARTMDESFPQVTYTVIDSSVPYAERQRLIAERAQLTIINIDLLRATPYFEDDDKRKEIISFTFSNPAFFVDEDFGQQTWTLEELNEKKGKRRFSYDFVCVDEYHRLKTPTALATRGFFELQGERWLLMSGTPILNRPEEIWTLLHKLYYVNNGYKPTTEIEEAGIPVETFGAFKKWIQPTVKGGLVVGYDPDSLAVLKAFIDQRSLRRRKDQVLKDLPTTITVPRYVTLTKEARKLYKQIDEEMELKLASGEVTNINGTLPTIMRLKQACFSPELYGGSPESTKIEELREIVAELVAEGQKCIIFSQFATACEIIRREFSEYNPAFVTGAVSPKDRSVEAHKFRTDPSCHIFVGSVGANRESINLGVATYVIFTDEDWTPTGKDQAIGRSAAGGLRGVGLGKDVKVHVIEMRAKDTIEEWIEDLVGRKRNVFGRFADKDGGTIQTKINFKELRNLFGRKEKKEKVKGGKAA